jgi:ATP synthase protein I
MARDDDDHALRARLDRLSGDLKARRGAGAPGPARNGGDKASDGFGAAMSIGLRAASEFAAAIVVGGLIGWQLDRWLGTKPGFLIAFFLIGVAAGVWNVIRVTSPLSRAKTTAKDEPKPPQAVDEDED